MQKVCKSKDGGLNDALKLARRVRSWVENDGVVGISAALELSGSWATTGTASRRRTAEHSAGAADCARSAGKNFRACGASQFLRGPR